MRCGAGLARLNTAMGCGNVAPAPTALGQKKSPASGAKWEEKPWNDTAPAERGDLPLRQSHEPDQHELHQKTPPHN